jgi:uncharacterized RDD family membrane protein YckC
MPEWRKELGERVREAQERKAREASLESGVTTIEAAATNAKAQPFLELLPQAEAPPVNPLVAAALRRIERAHVASRYGSNAVAVAYQPQTEIVEPVAQLTIPQDSMEGEPEPEQTEAAAIPERTHNLAVVPSPVVVEPEEPPVILKPKRLIIGDPNDPALNYLDSIPTTIHVDEREFKSAPLFARMFSAIVDLMVICLLSAPAIALVQLTDLKWQDVRVMTFAGSTLLLVGFLYLMITTAFTGRTAGMRLFSLRVVDARTGMIPTGGQSAGRAALYILSLAAAGLGLMYAFLDSAHHTIHDRFTRTAVIRK